MPNIFSPFQVKGIFLRNRVVMAPMVRGYPRKNGIMGEKLLQDYVGRSDKGIGLMISQVFSVLAEKVPEQVWQAEQALIPISILAI